MTVSATMRVTAMMWAMPNWSQASEYQLVTKLAGSQVSNHGLPSESTTTLTRTPIRKMKNAAIPAQTNHVVGEAAIERSPGARAPDLFLSRAPGGAWSTFGSPFETVCMDISLFLLSSPCTWTSATAGSVSYTHLTLPTNREV